MTDNARSPRFLERKSYRQRRLRDVVQVLPIFGGILWTIPLLWNGDAEDGVSNASALIYIFGIWVLLIALTAIIASLLAYKTEENDLGAKE